MRKVMGWLVGALAILIFLIFLSSPIWYVYGTTDTVVATLNGTEVKASGSGQSFKQVYLVFTDQGVFENTDSLMMWKWNSSDFHNQLMGKNGRKLRLSYYGWRVPLLSWYPNIYQVEEE